uniref:RRM domain-containing protein n=1 Tax=Sparus aurata TaxID=8175 RepID=A0A671UGT2_SPAAU
MAIILRLEGLDVKANAGDIRSFFKCFHIPDGGVYIVGGSLREAFIAFTSERDGQLAMRQTGQSLKGSQVTLHISSMEELEHKLKALLKRRKPSPSQLGVKRPRPWCRGLLYQGLAPGYVRLFGLPASATKEVICHFFKGLTVQEAIVNVKLGISHGCLVKFANEQEACEALLFNQRSLDQICVERVKLKQSPLRETANHKQNPAAEQGKRRTVNQLLSKPPKKPDVASTTALSTTMEYTLKVSNLPKTLMKTDIKELLGCPNIAHKNKTQIHFMASSWDGSYLMHPLKFCY